VTNLLKKKNEKNDNLKIEEIKKEKDDKNDQKDILPRRRFEVKDSPNKISKEIINELQLIILKDDPTEFVPANIRNILFCGASRSGKSTIFSILQNPCFCPEKITMFAETRFTNFKTFSLRDKSTGKVHNFVINLIDTPGTFEVRSTKEQFEKRSNDEISDLIVECVNHEITYLNLLVLVLSAYKFSDTEMDSIDLFLKLFGETKIPILLCLTHADGLGAQRMNDIANELKEHPRLSNYFNKKIFKICWMGCVNHVQRDYTDKIVMENDYKRVANWRDIFIEEIFVSEKRINLKETNIYLTKKENCKKILDLIINELNHLLKINRDPMSVDDNLRMINNTKKYELFF